MKLLKLLVAIAYWGMLAVLAIHATRLAPQGGAAMFHGVAYHLPTLAGIFVLSLQLDYLGPILKGEPVDVRARVLDFLHWLMLCSIQTALLISGQISAGWLALNMSVLAIIGASVGFGSVRQNIAYGSKEKLAAVVAGLIAVSLGLVMLGLRLRGTRPGEHALNSMGWGWWLDTTTSVVALFLVWGFITRDLAVIQKDYRPYPRSIFIKGVFGCNAMIAAGWLHGLTASSAPASQWVWENFGFTLVTLVGNIIYAYYYLAYEYHRHRQTRYATA